MKKNNNGNTMSPLHAFDNISGVWSYGNRSKTEITTIRKHKTADITARNTDLAFTVNIEGDLFSIRE